MKTLYLAAILMMAGGGFIIYDGNPLEPKAGDMLSEFYEQNRISTVIALEEFYEEGMDPKDPESFRWLATTLKDKTVVDRRELDQYIGGKIADGEIKDLIEDMKNYEVGNDVEKDKEDE